MGVSVNKRHTTLLPFIKSTCTAMDHGQSTAAIIPSISHDSTQQDDTSPSKKATSKSSQQRYGVHGVRLKHFEQVLADILPSVQPNYVSLPPPPLSNNATLWPFDRLPASARVFGNNPGQLPKIERATRKEQQLQSMLRCILQLIPSHHEKESSFTIVDFGGGSGHLGIPLALLLPECRVIVVDLGKRSLDLMHEKAELVMREIKEDSSLSIHKSKLPIPSWVEIDPAFRCCGRDGILENLLSFHGPVENYTGPIDMALALHLCGQATDVTLRKAASVDAVAIILAPCCVGKLSQQVRNPDVFHATGQNIATVSYPQSSTFCQLISQQADWDALVKAADYSNEQESRTSRNATRRTAKALLETDRRLFLETTYNYRTALMRMDPWEATPKNDILVAWNPQKIQIHDTFAIPDLDCMADLDVVTAQLLKPSAGSSSIAVDNSDWTKGEEKDIEDQIQNFLNRTADTEDKMDQVFIFPTRMGGRKRKLIHFVARRLDLAHWCVGDKDSEKSVAIARRGQRRREN